MTGAKSPTQVGTPSPSVGTTIMWPLSITATWAKFIERSSQAGQEAIVTLNHSKQTPHTWLIGVGVVLAVAVGVDWAELSDFAHVISRMY
jgi:hypothetical protein